MLLTDGERFHAPDRWREIPCSWAGRSNVVKATTLPNAADRLNATPINLPGAVFTELEQKIHNSFGNSKDPE